MPNYRLKTREELLYIIKDASEAAAAMSGHDPVAEAKYLDQVNDACTELNRRKQPFMVIRSPKQEWAAKKNAFMIVVNALTNSDAIRLAGDQDEIFLETTAPEYFTAPVAYPFIPNTTYSA